jgi:hypothetical protein
MPKVKTERIAGIVAMSYLVLIPTAAFLAYRKIQLLDQDIETLWEHTKAPTTVKEPLLGVDGVKRFFGTR